MKFKKCLSEGQLWAFGSIKKMLHFGGNDAGQQFADNILSLVWANLRIDVDLSAKLDSIKQTCVEFPLCAETI